MGAAARRRPRRLPPGLGLIRAFVVADERRLTHYPAARRNGV